MKKILVSLVVLLCAVTVFAMDIAGRVVLYPIVDKNGFRMDNAVFQLTSSVAGDHAGGSAQIGYAFAPRNKKTGFFIDGEIWFKPADDRLFGFGFQTQLVASKNYIPSETMCYGRLKYSFNEGQELKFKAGSIINSDFDYKNSKYFYVGNIEFLKNKKTNCNIANIYSSGLFKLENGTPRTEMLIAELAYLDKNVGNLTGKTGLKLENDKVLSGDNWGFGSYDGSIPKDAVYGSWTEDTTEYLIRSERLLKASVSYEYSYLNNEEDNGVFARVWLKDIPLNGGKFNQENTEDGSSMTVKASLGLKKSSLELGYHLSSTKNSPVDFATNATVDFLYRGNKEFKCVVPHVISEVNAVSSTPIRAWVEYKNDIHNADNSGVFANMVANGNIGMMAWNETMHIGFDMNGLKDDFYALGTFSGNF